MDSGSMSSVGISATETPPPGYMSEDGDPMDQNDNLSEFIVGGQTDFFFSSRNFNKKKKFNETLFKVFRICRPHSRSKRHQ
jgi:hypothetical protein